MIVRFLRGICCVALLPMSLSAISSGALPQSITEYNSLCKDHICRDYKLMFRDAPGGALCYPYITPGSQGYANVLWDWDSWTTDIALRQILEDVGTDSDRQNALVYEQGCILNFLHHTGDDGYMPMCIDKDSDPARIKPADIYATNMHKPVIAQHAAFLTKLNDDDASWLKDKYKAMKAFVDNYRTHHRHADTGLYFWQDDLAIGVDNDPSTFFRPKRSSASIYLNCLMYKELLAMSYLAKNLGQDGDATFYGDEAAALKAAVQEHCWDEKDGFFYSVDLNLLPVTNEPSIIFGTEMVLHSGMPRNYPCLIQRIGVWSGFLPMWAGIATPEQARRMVAENYRDTRTFNSPYGVRTLSKLEKMYNMTASSNPSNWQGPIWGISNYLVFRGLVNYGFDDDARDLAQKTVALFGRDFAEEGALHEYYNPETGEPIMNKGFQNWNFLVLNMIAWLEGRTPVTEF